MLQISEKLKKIIIDSVFPYVDVGILCYAKTLGNLRKALMTHGFSDQVSSSIILTLINLPKRGK